MILSRMGLWFMKFYWGLNFILRFIFSLSQFFYDGFFILLLKLFLRLQFFEFRCRVATFNKSFFAGISCSCFYNAFAFGTASIYTIRFFIGCEGLFI